MCIAETTRLPPSANVPERRCCGRVRGVAAEPAAVRRSTPGVRATSTVASPATCAGVSVVTDDGVQRHGVGPPTATSSPGGLPRALRDGDGDRRVRRTCCLNLPRAPGEPGMATTLGCGRCSTSRGAELSILLAAVLVLVGLAWAAVIGIPRRRPSPATTAWVGRARPRARPVEGLTRHERPVLPGIARPRHSAGLATSPPDADYLAERIGGMDAAFLVQPAHIRQFVLCKQHEFSESSHSRALGYRKARSLQFRVGIAPTLPPPAAWPSISGRAMRLGAALRTGCSSAGTR